MEKAWCRAAAAEASTMSTDKTDSEVASRQESLDSLSWPSRQGSTESWTPSVASTDSALRRQTSNDSSRRQLSTDSTTAWRQLSSDSTPPPRRQLSSDSTPPPRRQLSSDSTPPPRRQLSSDSTPPPRRQLSSDSTPPPRRQLSSDSTPPPRRQLSSDSTPPTRRQGSGDSYTPPPRRQGSAETVNPPRRLVRLQKIDSGSLELENCGSPKRSPEGRPESSKPLVQRSASKESRDGSRPTTPKTTPKSTPKTVPKLASLGRDSKGSQSSTSCAALSRQSSRDSNKREHSNPDSASSSPLLPHSCRSTPKLTERESQSSSPSFNNNDCDYIEEEKPLVPGVSIRAASITKLVQAASLCFDEDGKVEDGNEFPRVLLLMHEWFSTSEQLAELMLDLYKQSEWQVSCSLEGCSHDPSLSNCEIQLARSRICHLLRYWIRQFPIQFDIDRKLHRVVQRFQELIDEEGDSQNRDLIDVSKVPTYEWMRNMSVKQPVARLGGNKVSLVFTKLQPSQLAEQFTYLEYKAFRRITFKDFKHYAIHASLKDNPKLERSIALFNGLSQWVQCMVLSKTTPQQRANVITKFVDVALRLKELQNYNTLMAVVGGLTHSALARLSKTNSYIHNDTQKVLMELTELLSSSNNFSNYRRALQNCHGFRIPILGVHLKDLILLNTALQDRTEGSLVNFRKMAQLSIIFTELMLVQKSNLPVEPNMDLVNMIKLSLDLHYTEDEIYELSLAREPRTSLSSPSTPTKPVVFADWAAGLNPPDPETINKHVHDMVEAVFKNYDHDKDGFISHNEFEEIAGNFPFIDSFCVLDADKDGMISKAEMKTYFIRANCHALRNSFKHDFHETTYFKPTFCIHCTGLLWGLIKQGWKCRECAINAHKHCKDLVVMECRSKQHASTHRSSSITNGGSRDVTIAAKRKMSQRHRRLFSSRSTQTDEGTGGSSACSSPKVSLREADSIEAPLLPSSSIGDTEFYEDQTSLYERLTKADEAREKLEQENKTLRQQIELQREQIITLKSHIGTIRQNTITFILDQMETLHMQRDTEV